MSKLYCLHFLVKIWMLGDWYQGRIVIRVYAKHSTLSLPALLLRYHHLEALRSGCPEYEVQLWLVSAARSHLRLRRTVFVCRFEAWGTGWAGRAERLISWGWFNHYDSSLRKDRGHTLDQWRSSSPWKCRSLHLGESTRLTVNTQQSYRRNKTYKIHDKRDNISSDHNTRWRMKA